MTGMEPFDLPPEIFGRVPLFAEIAKAMSWTGGPVNWDLARQIASAMAATEQTAPIIEEDRAELGDAARLTQSWLVEATALIDAPEPPRVLALGPQQWVDRALRLYPELIDPLAAKLAGAVAQEDPSDPGDASGLANVVGQLVPLLLGIQTGTILGSLSRSALTGYDLALPVEEDGVVAIVVPHVDAHAREFGLDRRESRYWTTLRAVATRLAFDAQPWTRAQFFSLYHQFLAAVDLDLGEALERLQHLDLSSPDQLQGALGEGLFGFAEAPSAGPALENLQRYLGLLEATIDAAVRAAATARLAGAARIAESVARRRTADGAGEGMLQRFIGVQVPPNVARATIEFVERVVAAGGWPLIWRAWSDPDRSPTAADISDPDAWIQRAG
jgi:putative hydrolase